MNLRPYQLQCLDAVDAKLAEHQSTLVVQPTGTGKTVVFAHAIKRRLRSGKRALVIAHREELIHQAAHKIEAVIGEKPDIEMSAYRADLHMFRRTRVVVASKDSLHKSRLARFKPDDFDLVITDEAHHAVAGSYKSIYKHFLANPKCKHLGVTATPDRADEAALGEIFESVAFDYEIKDAIDDGWLVDIASAYVPVHGLDFSNVKITAGDLNQGQVAEIVEDEKISHQVVSALVPIAGDKKSIVFATTLKHAEQIATIINRHKEESARFVSGYTPKDERAKVLEDYRLGKFQHLVNVGVFTEGFDEPGIEIVCVARFTKSRALYAQMIGRGTRPLPGVVDGVETAEGRRAAILASAKPKLTVLDFEGNNGRHKLATALDILGGKINDTVMQAAQEILKKATKAGKPITTNQAIEEAEAEIKRRVEEAEAKRKAQRDERKKIVAKADYTITYVNPFDRFDKTINRTRDWNLDRPATEKQVAALRKFGIEEPNMTFKRATHLMVREIARANAGKCSFKQANLLEKYGYSRDLPRETAGRIITEIKNNGWRKPVTVTAPPPRKKMVPQ